MPTSPVPTAATDTRLQEIISALRKAFVVHRYTQSDVIVIATNLLNGIKGVTIDTYGPNVTITIRKDYQPAPNPTPTHSTPTTTQ